MRAARRRLLGDRAATSARLNLESVLAAAAELGVRVEERPGGFLELRHGPAVSLAYETNFAFEPLVPYFACGDKALTSAILAGRGMPVPDFAAFGPSRYQDALRFFRSLPKPVVTKPVRGTYGGTGVTLDSVTEQQFRRGFSKACSFGGEALVERRVTGHDLRVTVLDGTIIGQVRRRPANVLGDGTSTVEALVSAKNGRWRSGARDNTIFRPIVVDREARRVLHNQGLSPHAVPAAGRTVFLRDVCNADQGGEIVDVELHEDLRHLALEAAAALGAVLCGVDLIVGDLDGAPASGSVHINEVNTTPSLYVANAMREGRPSTRAAAAVLRRLFDLDG